MSFDRLRFPSSHLLIMPRRTRRVRPSLRLPPRSSHHARAGSTPTRRRPGAAGADHVDLDATLDFLRLIWALDHGLQVSSKRMATDVGVTGPQRLVVRLVGKHPGISAGELATILHVHKSTISGIIHRLETRRLLTRASDAQDARRTRLSLTGTGRRLSRRLPNTVEAAVKRALSSIDAPTVEASRRVLGALAHELTHRRR
jgi:DNA-binding MarR family transcriptional regulator